MVMQRIGIYGGTFNPPHTGHICAGLQALQALNLSMLYVIPDRIAPHKQIPEGSPSPEQRLQMLRLALDGESKVVVSDLELKREGKSFTYETVEQLRLQHPDAELVLFMGTDMFLTFHQWRCPERILAQASLGVFYRGDRDEQAQISARKAEMEAQGNKVYLVSNDVVEISSTNLRRMLTFRCADPFLPKGVGEYIRGAGSVLSLRL
jgi:nicotinate-nucleotide adenylyltransferase